MLQKVIAKILIYRRETSTLFVSGIIMQKQGGEGRGGRIGRDQNGADGPDKLLDLWTRWRGERRGGGRGGRGGERTVLGSTPVCYRRNLRSFREGEGRGPTSEGRRRTGHECKPRVRSFFVPSSPRSLPFPPRERISNVSPSPSSLPRL